jgi:alpha,alpha-trehalase
MLDAMNRRPILPRRAFVGTVVASAWLIALCPPTLPWASAQKPADILSYIASSWDTLTRSPDRCETVADPKVTSYSYLYMPADSPMPAAVQDLRRECHVAVERLPKNLHGVRDSVAGEVAPAGLLYLEHPYVVPGGRFNEMYGWDSYFIIRGLLRDGRLDLARGMVENFFFEIEHYGAVLNANRTYYLTRSQPPFLTSMILAVYDAERAAGREDREWLAKAYDFAAKDYALWTRKEHLAGGTGLSRYHDYGNGPAPETVKDEPDYYAKVAAFFRAHPDLNHGELLEGTGGAAPRLSASYYAGDRAMRESGFDISFRFDPYGARTQYFAPVCLNSLLYKEEKDLEQIGTVIGRDAEAREWQRRANARRQMINRYLWDAERGEFFDYDFSRKVRSTYEYATTFYPLWAGLATEQQARAVAQNLKIFEQPGGLVMSGQDTGVQWDYPYAWAPVELLAVEGLRHYGFDEEANRISREFLSMVRENFEREGTIREKYNAVTRSSEVKVSAGYAANVVGFGWTNGVFLELLHELPQGMADNPTSPR